MTTIVALNELSLRAADDIIEGKRRMSEFMRCIGTLAAAGVTDPIRIPCPLDGFELAKNYPIGTWRGDPEVDLELRRSYKSRVGTGPYLSSEDLDQLRDDEEVGVEIDGQSALGCEVAFLLAGMAVSLSSDSRWDTHELAVCVNRLMAGDDAIVQSHVHLRHVSRVVHVDNHLNWIGERFRGVKDAEDLWLRRNELFPHLQFATSTLRELRSAYASGDAFNMIVAKLFSLEKYFLMWDGNLNLDQIGMKCTPETPKTLEDNKKNLTFKCADGVNRLFSLHARFTPGSGRIYFFPDAVTKLAHIGYIGEKIAL